MILKIKIADIIIKIESGMLLYLDEGIKEFQIREPESKNDISIYIREEKHLEINFTNIAYKDDYTKIEINGDNIRYGYFMRRRGKEAHAILSAPKSSTTYELLVDPVFNDMFTREGKIYPYLGIEQILLNYQAFYLHSSFVKYADNGILFTAASGVGKSTQANLWQLYEQAEICNGDKTIIRKKEDGYYAYGSPFAGSSRIYKNESARIRGIIVLSQAKDNTIERMCGKEAFLSLYKESIMNTWDVDYMKTIVDVLMDMVQNVPIFHLACRPDREAVQLVKQVLFE